MSDLETLINKKWPGAIMKGSDPSLAIEKIPCGILSVDYLLGGGFARNRHTELYGSYSTGKTYTALRLIAKAQSLGYKCAYIDAERSFDPAFAEYIGVNLDELIYHRQETGNRVIDFVEVLLRSQEIDVAVVDSIAALLPKQELEQDMEKGSYGTQQAKLMSAAMRRITAANSRTAIVYINQLRDNIGSMFKSSNTSGGRAMSFYAGVRLEMAKIETIKGTITEIDPKGQEKEVKVPTGHRVQVKIEKSKVGGAKTQDKISFVFDYTEAGINIYEDIIYLGQVLGKIKRSGNSWIIADQNVKIVGRDKFLHFLEKEELVFNTIKEEVERAVYG